VCYCAVGPGLGNRYGDSTLPKIVYAGGYGGAEYNESIQLLCRVVAADTNYSFAFAPHPGYEAAGVEREIFAAFNVSGRIKVVPPGLGTAVVTAASNASLSDGSSVGVQSLAIGRLSAFMVNQSGVAALNASWGVVVERGLIKVASTPTGVAAVLHEFAVSPPPSPSRLSWATFHPSDVTTDHAGFSPRHANLTHQSWVGGRRELAGCSRSADSPMLGSPPTPRLLLRPQ
jgi:hypothetical protein